MEKKVQHELVASWKNTQLRCQWRSLPGQGWQSSRGWERCWLMALKGKQHPYSHYAGWSERRVFTCPCYVLCEWTHTSGTNVTASVHATHCFFSSEPVCFLVWVSGSVCDWLAKCRSSWEYKLGRHIKSRVSCWSSLTWGSAHSLNFPAFQLVYSGTCQAFPPYEKPSACR